ncbi:MAG: DUF3137 domain-containing protein [Alphaproteobacteria bacterium]|nr:DUF3137 domain-containing protein [Alphaproteobacteria bacterium]
MSKRGRREFEAKEKNRHADLNDVGEVDRIDEQRFTKKLKTLIKESEAMRLDYMRKHRMRSWMAMNLTIFFVVVGSAAFGWFFMIQAQIVFPFVCLFASFVPAIFLNVWAARPIKSYALAHKNIFMPKMAKALNGLSFHPARGVSAKMIEKLAVVPAHDRYDAEDCFMGRYKGMKVIFSEARLYSKIHKDGPVFQGLFVLLEAPEDIFEGHTVITANDKMVKAYASTRWKTMSPVNVPVPDPAWDRFTIYSTEPEAAVGIVNERLLKELAEASDIFDKSPLTAVLFKKRYIFMMIPHDEDMFEASDLFVPVTTKDQALRVKNEIEQLLEVVDVFDLYSSST